jgi:branched-chain amino acid transport system substrate-binding protein
MWYPRYQTFTVRQISLARRDRSDAFSFLILLLALVVSPTTSAQTLSGEIKIGNTMPYSGPASAYGTIGRAQAAYFKMLNEKGGIDNRKINFLSFDDAYSPAKTVEQTRRLVESDEVLLMFGAFGTATVSAVQKYLADQKVPQLFFVTGASKWEARRNFPEMVGWQPTYRAEAIVYARYLLRTKPDAKIGVLYQNDDYGKDYLQGMRDGLGTKADDMIVKELTYQVSDPTIDSQIVALKASGADVFFDVTTAKFAAQAIRKIDEIGWKPLHFLNSISSSVATVLIPAGLDKSAGIVSAAYSKDPTDPQFKDDQGVHEYRVFMHDYYPEGDPANIINAIAYSRAMTLAQVLKQCGHDLSRENIMRQADSLDVELPMLLPGIRIQTSPERPFAITQMQLQRFNGSTWERFGELIRLQ